MGKLLKTITVAILFTFVSSQSIGAAASAPIFISGAASNAIFQSFLGRQAELSQQKLVLSVKEDAHSFAFVLHTDEGRTTLDADAELATAPSILRSPESSEVFSPSTVGTKTLQPLQITAMLGAMAYVDRNPLRTDDVQTNARLGAYLLEITQDIRGKYIYVYFSYPGNPDDVKTSLRCNPRRQFRFDTFTGTLAEMTPTCP
jgi:hypothetical protein